MLVARGPGSDSCQWLELWALSPVNRACTACFLSPPLVSPFWPWGLGWPHLVHLAPAWGLVRMH